MSVSVPVASGGCGNTHSRPVRDGVPARDFRLDCPGCEKFLKGGGRTVLQYTPGDREAGILPVQERVADCDPCWGATPEAVPESPDERQYTRKRNKLGAEELEWVRALAAAKQAGISIPDNAMALLEARLGTQMLRGKTVCFNGHDNTSGTKFCSECGVNMASKAAVEAPDKITDYSQLSTKQLQELCKMQKLPTYGSKKQLVERLS
jgi:hypothetical protein